MDPIGQTVPEDLYDTGGWEENLQWLEDNHDICDFLLDD